MYLILIDKATASIEYLTVFPVVWVLDSEPTMQQRLLAALAASREKLDKLDYAIVDADRLYELGVKTLKTPGRSLDAGLVECHRDLAELTGSKLIGIARIIRDEGEKRRVDWRDLGVLIAESIALGRIGTRDLADKLLQRISRIDEVRERFPDVLKDMR